MLHRRISSAAGAAAAAAAVLIALPAFSGGATVKPDLQSYKAAPAQPRAISTNPTTEPPLHGTNPHGQGTVATVDVAPSAQRPFSSDPTVGTDSEDVIVGRARGERRTDGTYHGHVTVASAFGMEILAGADTTAGQSVDTNIVPQDLLNLCNATGICLNAVNVRSSTTTTGSTNQFSVVDATIGALIPGAGLSIGTATSNGNITTTDACQISHGDSNVLDVSAGASIAEASTSASTTTACRGLAPVQTNSSSVLSLGQTLVVIPPLLTQGCATGVPDSVSGIPILLPIVCNADDSSASGGIQSSDPYGVRDALDVYVGAVGPTALAKISTSSSESLAVAPAAATTPPVVTPPPAVAPPPAAVTPPAIPAGDGTGDGTGAGTGDDDGDGTGDDDGDDDGAGAGTPDCSDRVDNDGDGKIDFGKDPGCSSADDDSEADGATNAAQLPFTGTDIVVLGLAGSILLAAGLALRRPARRRELRA